MIFLLPGKSRNLGQTPQTGRLRQAKAATPRGCSPVILGRQPAVHGAGYFVFSSWPQEQTEMGLRLRERAVDSHYTPDPMRINGQRLEFFGGKTDTSSI